MELSKTTKVNRAAWGGIGACDCGLYVSEPCYGVQGSSTMRDMVKASDCRPRDHTHACKFLRQ